jgi:hypothetical protein
VDGIGDLHRLVGYSIPSGFAVLSLWSLYAFVRNKPPGENFWRLLAVLQVVIGLQIIVGGVLFATGLRPQSNGPQWLHYAYGGLFPAIVLVLAHRFARRAPGIPWIVFGVAGLVCFGLTFRALQTGLGID